MYSDRDNTRTVMKTGITFVERMKNVRIETGPPQNNLDVDKGAQILYYLSNNLKRIGGSVNCWPLLYLTIIKNKFHRL